MWSTKVTRWALPVWVWVYGDETTCSGLNITVTIFSTLYVIHFDYVIIIINYHLFCYSINELRCTMPQKKDRYQL